MKIEVALTAPDYKQAPSAVYVGDGADYFRQAGAGSGNASRQYLKNNGAQFHTVEIPDWKDPTKLAVEKLNTLVANLEWDFLGNHANKATEIVNILKGAN